MLRSACALSSLVLAACAPELADVSLPALAAQNAKAELEDGQAIELDAWVRDSGELLLFDSQQAMTLGLVYPYCISAGFDPRVSHTKATDLNGKRVRIRGTLLRSQSPPEEPNTIATSSIIGGMFFKNWCFGPYVLRIEDLTVR